MKKIKDKGSATIGPVRNRMLEALDSLKGTSPPDQRGAYSAQWKTPRPWLDGRRGKTDPGRDK